MSRSQSIYLYATLFTLISCQGKEERFVKVIKQSIESEAAAQKKTVDLLDVSGLTYKEVNQSEIDFVILSRLQNRIRSYNNSTLPEHFFKPLILSLIHI